MKTLLESNWSGWNAAAHDKGDPTGQIPPQLIKADNLNFDEQGVVRSIRPPKKECTNLFNSSDIYSIFSTYINGVKTRFIYINNGANKEILATSSDPTTFDTVIANQVETAPRCKFINALGMVVMCAGAIQIKYDASFNKALGIAVPTAPTLTGVSTYSIDLNNLDGSSHYTNWTSVLSASFTNSGTKITGTGTPVPSSIANNFAFQTVFGSVKDTTNLNGAGKDTPDDIFQFTFEIDDVTQLVWVRMELFMGTPPAANDYFWKEWDFPTSPDTTPNPDSPYAPFPISSGISTVVTLKRSDWFSVGNPDWAKVKAIRVTVGVSDVSSIDWSGFKVFGGTDSVLTGDFDYITAWADNASGWYELSPSSTKVSITGLYQQSVTVTPPGAAPDNANEWWIFRRDVTGGNFYHVAHQAGAYGFTPTAYLDHRLLDDLLIDAAINPLYTLQYYRTALPTTVKDMIWFKDRLIYLTDSGFLPSFKLDPGSYDSRFKYELVGSNNEICLFIAKLDVGTFIVATDVDFYRVTGTFNVIYDPNDPTGQTQLQDVSIVPLGIKSPAISYAWTEYQGSIMYVGADGIRLLTSGSSTLINDNMDLLFRGEARSSVPALLLPPRDTALIGLASAGQRIYFSLPHTDSKNRTYVLTVINQTNALYLNNRSWRLITNATPATNAISMFKEEDGTVLYGSKASASNYIYSFETDQTLSTNVAILFQNQFNYHGNPTTRKDPLSFRAKVDTNTQDLTLTISGLYIDNVVYSKNFTINCTGDTLLDLTIQDAVPPCLAFQVTISGNTKFFKLQWFTIGYEERPAGTRRIILFADNFDSGGRKRIAQWAFLANTLGLESATPATITATVTADKTIVSAQTFTGLTNQDYPETFKWQCNQATDLLARDWQMELTADKEFELHKVLPPVITQKTPELIKQVIYPANNFGTKARKCIGLWGFRANLFTNTATVTVRADNVALATQTFTGTADKIQTFNFIIPVDTFATDWEMEINVTTGTGMEFYEFYQPTILKVFPETTKEFFFPADNFGSRGRKRVGTWDFRANLRSSTVTVTVKYDNVALPVQTFTAGDLIKTFQFIPPDDLLGIDLELTVRVTSGVGMEFYELYPPVITQQCPELTHQAILPTSNFDSAARKRIGDWPFVLNGRNHTPTALCRVDGIDQTPVAFGVSGADEIQTFNYYPPKDLLGVDWQLRINCDAGMEFYKFLPPAAIQSFPTKTKHAIQPSTNLGKCGPKQVTVWAFQAKPLGAILTVRVTADGQAQPDVYLGEINNTTVQTLFWRNTIDLRAVDWQIEVFSTNEFEFIKFMPPELLQIYPVAKLIDQIGPLDLNKEAIVFGARFRIMGSTMQTIHYTVADADDVIFTDDLAVTPFDGTYIVKFTKGVRASTCKLTMTSPLPFYRFSVELKIRLTGNETEEKYIMVPDVNAR